MSELFIQNKYSTYYYKIIEKAKNQERKKNKGIYYESHHIVPKSLGGSNNKTNLVLLTAKEHFICHRLLTKMCVLNSNKIKMLYALHRLANGNNLLFTSQQYLIARTALIEANKNRICTEETRQKLREAGYKRKHSEKTKEKISKIRKGKKFTDEQRKRISDSLKDKKPTPGMTGKTHNEETKSKLREARLKYLASKKDH
jgi:hypothetical protein